jgi:hypothetical protein
MGSRFVAALLPGVTLLVVVELTADYPWWVFVVGSVLNGFLMAAALDWWDGTAYPESRQKDRLPYARPTCAACGRSPWGPPGMVYRTRYVNGWGIMVPLGECSSPHGRATLTRRRSGPGHTARRDLGDPIENARAALAAYGMRPPAGGRWAAFKREQDREASERVASAERGREAVRRAAESLRRRHGR